MELEELGRLIAGGASRFGEDPFREIQAATDAHRSSHGCWAYPYDEGSRLGTIAAAIDARRVLELGTALGYTALWFAHGAPEATIDTIERDPDHVRLARSNIAAAAMSKRIVVHEGDFETILPRFSPGYDLVFFDGYAPTMPIMAQVKRLLADRGVLISANLTLGGGDGPAYRKALRDQNEWQTVFPTASEETAVSKLVG